MIIITYLRRLKVTAESGNTCSETEDKIDFNAEISEWIFIS